MNILKKANDKYCKGLTLANLGYILRLVGNPCQILKPACNLAYAKATAGRFAIMFWCICYNYTKNLYVEGQNNVIKQKVYSL